MNLNLQCSNCGKHLDLQDAMMKSVFAAVEQGWGSYGDALYCPECSATWYDRNTKPMAHEFHTVLVILEKAMKRVRMAHND